MLSELRDEPLDARPLLSGVADRLLQLLLESLRWDELWVRLLAGDWRCLGRDRWDSPGVRGARLKDRPPDPSWMSGVRGGGASFILRGVGGEEAALGGDGVWARRAGPVLAGGFDSL